jgi:uncharacterized RDD family membrane protein YckC
VSQDQPRNSRGLLGRFAARANDRVLELVDPDVVLDHVDVNALLDRVDVNALLSRVEVNDLLDRVEVNQLLDRVDVDALLDRADVDALLARADIDALLEKVDVRALVDRAGIPEIVAESTGHIGGSALNLFRRPLVGLDEIVFRALVRLIGRDPNAYPSGPGALITWVDEQADDISQDHPGATKTGRYAGPVTRMLALAADVLLVTSGFTLVVAGLAFLIRLFAPEFSLPEETGVGYAIALGTWAFLYSWVGLAVWGKTPGKAILGLRVVTREGSVVLTGGQALIRTLTYPLSFALFGIGLLGVVFNSERRAWHDRFAGSAVVYDWGSRTAVMPTPLAEYLRRRGAEV